MRMPILLGVALMMVTPARADERTTFSDGRADIAVRVAGEIVPYRVMALSVLPGARFDLDIVSPDPNERYVLHTPDGERSPTAETGWTWTAPPASGLRTLHVTRAGASDGITLHVFILVPLEEVRDERLNGYRIGSYPATPFRGLAAYENPPGFIEVTKQNETTQVSPHFRLRQFLCKQEGGYPKYVALRTPLLLKLELLLQRVNAAGLRADSFHVMSGYRTPHYNAAIGNVRYSRHLWGDGADIFIDEAPSDGMMDDLNDDGRIDVHDAAVLYDLVERLRDDPQYTPFVGGLGRYGRTAAHGPFVHVDVRGYRARWGD